MIDSKECIKLSYIIMIKDSDEELGFNRCENCDSPFSESAIERLKETNEALICEFCGVKIYFENKKAEKIKHTVSKEVKL